MNARTLSVAEGYIGFANGAFAYAKLGWPVFPLVGKLPAIAKERGGRGVHNATTDPQVIRGWAQRYPMANVGVACGERSGFWVLDVDTDKDGPQSLDALIAQHGPLPETVEAITGSGGTHYLFSYHGEEIRNRAGKLGAGLDVRSTGGYIVVAPSIHPDTRRAYAWRHGFSPWERAIAEAPEWLIGLVTADPRPAVPPSQPIASPDGWGPKPAYAQAALDAAAHSIAQAVPGTQEATLNAEAYSIGTLVGAGLMPVDFARAVLIRAGGTMVSQPGRRAWHTSEIATKVSRAMEAGAFHPREVR